MLVNFLIILKIIEYAEKNNYKNFRMDEYKKCLTETFVEINPFE